MLYDIVETNSNSVNLTFVEDFNYFEAIGLYVLGQSIHFIGSIIGTPILWDGNRPIILML